MFSAVDDIDAYAARRAIRRIRDARVIHQDIELAEVRLDPRRRRRDGFHPRDIQFDEPHVEPFARERVRGLAAGRRVACPEQDDVTGLRDPACGFEADAFVGARYKGDAGCPCGHDIPSDHAGPPPLRSKC